MLQVREWIRNGLPGMDQEWTGNGSGMDWEQIRNETPFPGMNRTFRNELGISGNIRNEPGVHKEWWGSVKFCTNGA